MDEEHVLTPHEAETVVDERIERFGPGALPHVNVTASADGHGRFAGSISLATVTPMTQNAWCAWLEENVGSLDAGDLQTTES